MSPGLSSPPMLTVSREMRASPVKRKNSGLALAGTRIALRPASILNRVLSENGIDRPREEPVRPVVVEVIVGRTERHADRRPRLPGPDVGGLRVCGRHRRQHAAGDKSGSHDATLRPPPAASPDAIAEMF